MSADKKRSPRLGRGLSSLMSSPVAVQPPAPDTDDQPEESALAAAESVESGPAPAESTKPPAGRSAPGSAPGSAHAPIRKPPADTVHAATDGRSLAHLPVANLQPNRHQPRQRFDETGLNRLADSIKAEGVMQPIVARPIPVSPDKYEIVAGERRWRAARLAGLKTVPVIVRELNDRQIAEWALIENLQREDLNPIERAEAFARLIDQFGLSHEEAGARVGMDRSSISNHLRLLTLAGPVKQLIIENLLSMGQARALAGLSDPGQQKMLAERAVRQGMSVREVEAAVRKLTSPPAAASAKSSNGKAAYLVDLEKQIAQQLGTRVTIKPGRKKGAGTLSIEFYNLDQFDALAQRLGVKTD